MDDRLYLKIKIQSLAEEARLIRREENRQKTLRRQSGTPTVGRFARAERYFWGLREHRINDVRDEQRATLLAYAFLRGKTYAEAEGNARQGEPRWRRVLEMVLKYGDRTTEQRDAFTAWVESAGWVHGRRAPEMVVSGE